MGSLGTGALAALFLIAALATWLAGIRLADATDVIDERFNLGTAVGGMILLGLAGTLPELAITVSAAAAGNLGLAVGNLLGGIAMQTLVLALTDGVSGSPAPLSTLSKHIEPMFEAILVIILLTLALMGALVPVSADVGRVSMPSVLIVLLWLGGLVILSRVRTSQHWQAIEVQMDQVATPHRHHLLERKRAREPKPNRYAERSTRFAIAVFGFAALATLVAGVVLEQTGNALAKDFGINGAVFGATVLAAVTALPEVSTAIRAVRLGSVELAMGDIFGGNAVQLTLFFVADLIAGKSVLASTSAQSSWLGSLGVIVTAVYAAGLLIRPARKVLGLGPDSWLVVIFYTLGIVGLTRL